MKKALIYMFVEGLTRGIPQVILIVLALWLDKNTFTTLALLYGLESLLVILLPSNYVEVLFQQTGNRKEKTANTILAMNAVILTVILCFFLLLNQYAFDFFSYESIYVYIAIVFSAFVNSYVRFYRTQLQILFEHEAAIKTMLYSFGLANIGMVFFLLIFDDTIMAFFLGKAIGFLLYFLWFIYKFEIKISFDKDIFAGFLSRIKYLFAFAIYSWLFGYGFMYIVKFLGTNDDVANIGYVITFSMPFLLVANGINQVYTPKVKKIISENFNLALLLSKKILYAYIAIFLLVLTLILLISQLEYDIIHEFNEVIIISSVIFLVSSYKYAYEVYVYVFDKFKPYVFFTILIETLALVVICTFYYLFNVNLVYLYPLLIFSRNIYIYILVKQMKEGRLCQ